MNTIIGLIIIAIGSMGQSSSYVPINKVKEWSWENFWLVQGIFAWLVFPLLGAFMAISLPELIAVYSANAGAALQSVGYGILWGIGGLTFGLSMRYLGIALGQSVALGTCAAFGTLIPAVIAGDDLFSPKGLVLLLAVVVTLLGIALVGYAGSLRSRNMSEEERKKAIKDFALKKGFIALFAGVMSACFSLGLSAGIPIKEAAIAAGSKSFAQNPVTLGCNWRLFHQSGLLSRHERKTRRQERSERHQTDTYQQPSLLCPADCSGIPNSSDWAWDRVS